MTLYELDEAYLTLLEELEAGGLEESEILKLAQKATVDDMDFGEFVAVKQAIIKKAESYAKVLIEAEAKLLAVKGEIERLTERKKNIEANIKGLQQDIGESLNLLGFKKMEYPLFNVKVSSSESVVVDSLEDVPNPFKKRKISFEVDGTEEIPTFIKERGGKVVEEAKKKEIKEALSKGNAIDGVHMERKSTAKVQ